MIDYAAILERAHKGEQELVDFLVDLLAIPSPSGKEGRVTERIAAEMRRLGFDEARIDGLGNVIGRIGNGPRLVAFDAHVDTVEAGDRTQWSFDPFQPRVSEGKVWGRGAADQKGGLASMVHAGRIVRELDRVGEGRIRIREANREPVAAERNRLRFEALAPVPHDGDGRPPICREALSPELTEPLREDLDRLLRALALDARKERGE